MLAGLSSQALILFGTGGRGGRVGGAIIDVFSSESQYVISLTAYKALNDCLELVSLLYGIRKMISIIILSDRRSVFGFHGLDEM